MLRLCDGTCLDINDSIDILQIRTIIESEKKNVKKLNTFLRMNAGKMMNALINSKDENIQSLCICIYFNVLTSRQINFIQSLPDSNEAKKLFSDLSSGKEKQSMGLLNKILRKVHG